MKKQTRLWALLLSFAMIFSLGSLVSCDTGADNADETSGGISESTTGAGTTIEPESATGAGTTTEPESVTGGETITEPYPEASKGLSFKLNDDGAFYSVAGVGTCTDTDIVIPHTYAGLPVTTIALNAFEDCTSLTSITIPDSVTSIDGRAFSGCDNLTYTVYDNGKYLGNAANPHHALIEATAPSISSCTIHENTKVIADGALSYTSLVNVTISDSVTSIGSSAFGGCESLTSVTIGDSVTSIGSYAFYGCESLTSVTVPDNVQKIGKGLFYNCVSLTSVKLPSDLTEIPAYTFWGCSALTSYPISEKITVIGEGAFRDCTALTSVTIPATVAKIGSQAYYNCSNLTYFEMNAMLDFVLKVDEDGNPVYDENENRVVDTEKSMIGEYMLYRFHPDIEIVYDAENNLGMATYYNYYSLDKEPPSLEEETTNSSVVAN